MSGNSEWTVGRYLATRLEQLGIRHLFGVPGDHLGPFLTIMHATTGVRWVGTPTEIGGGYAADAYARVRAADADLAKGEQGVAAVAVTYGVGAFSLLNPIGGAYVEYVPVIAINAAPSYEQWINYQAVGLLTSHMSQRRESNLEVYRQVTVDAQVISNPGLAPSQIDSAITAGLTERRPVYLEVMDDLWNAPCAAPQGELRRQERPFTKKNEEMLAKAVEASVKLVERLGTPVLWAGEEIERNRLERELVSLVQLTGIPFCTTVGAKSVVSENTPGFTGVYNGKASLPEVRKAFTAAGCRIGLGTWSTSKNLGGEKSIGDDWIVAAHEGVSVGAQYFPDVQLARFVPALRDALGVTFGKRAFETDLFALAHAKDRQVPASTIAFLTSLSSTDYPEELTYDGFFQHMNAFLLSQAQGDGPEATSPFTVVSDAAFALLGSMNLQMAERASFVAQNSWLSIGYSVGAATGVALARQQPLKRPLVFVGDGSFQEICQELSTHVRHHLRPVVFVLDNEGFYGIEQMLVSPCYYKEKPSDGADFYNVLHPWQYEKLAEVFGSEKDRMHGRELTTHTELESLLLDIADPGSDINHAPILVRVRLNRHDYPRALQYKIDEKCK
ncbi:thiamine pyrophosphate-binding protein [Streptomyces sp. NBC_01224]|uniref:alpha-keto acid decarboxylase family protein n=1 Tax=Streptomyces sp. NBC_01224 TaxID=2903783 RepID=UPI002E0EB50C|nr:thiamine pyrophosphate-binding protein [Streptomyces sp. NBC_01224]